MVEISPSTVPQLTYDLPWLTTGPTRLWTAVVLGSAVCGLVGWGYRRVAGTTLVASWGWAMLAAVAVVLVEVIVAASASRGAWVGHARYLAATLTLCPGVALLGAKRPQHQAWQLIVASLWVVLVLPSAEGWLDRPSDPVHLTPARQVFVLGLAALGWANFLGTRNFMSASLLLAGQVCLLAESLAMLGGMPTIGFGGLVPRPVLPLLAATLGLGWALRPRPAPPPGESWVWHDFRDLFGCLWAWRVAGRVNAWAQSQGSDLRLGWEGWHRLDGRPLDEASRGTEGMVAAERQLVSLLRRFVSSAWVSARDGGV